jgi:hypothetical protein
MPKKKPLTEDEIFKIHDGDFSQGNTEEDTLSILKAWWNKEKNKYSNPN